MTRRLKLLGVALVVLAAFGGASASGAGAGAFDVAVLPGVITGHSTSPHTFTLTTKAGTNVKAVCDTHTLEGTTSGGEVKDLTLTTIDTECIAFGLAAQILMNGCKDTLTGEGQAAGTFLIDIVGCTSGKSIEIKTLACTIDIPPQNGIPHVAGLNQFDIPHTVSLETTGSEIETRQTGPACPDGNNFVAKNGSTFGSFLIEAFQDLGSALVTKHGHQYAQYKDGIQANLTVT